MMSDFVQVPKEEFEAFMKAYPRPVEFHLTTICEPPMGSWNDFERGHWPDSMVAKQVENSYYVLKDINASVPDDGTRDTDTPVLDIHGVAVKEGDRIRAGWGGSCWITKLGSSQWEHHFREHIVVIKDKGTKYERWGLHDCENYLRSLEFEILPQQPIDTEKAA